MNRKSYILILCLSSVTQAATRPEVVLKLGHGLDIMHPVHMAMVFMA